MHARLVRAWLLRRPVSIATFLIAALCASTAGATPDDRAFRNWGPPFEQGFRARAAFWDATNVVLETTARHYVFIPMASLAPEDRAYLSAFPSPPIMRDRLRWSVTPLAREIPKMPVDGFSGRVIAFNGREFLVAVRNDRISDTLHPPSMLTEESLDRLMDLHADELNPEERILAAAATREALWTPNLETAPNVLPKGAFDDVLPAGALPIAYDGFWLAYKDPPGENGAEGALRTMRVSEADARAMKLREFLLEKFVAEARYLPGRADPSLMRAFARKERLTSAPVGEARSYQGAPNRGGSPVEGRWVYRDGTGSVIVLPDGTLDVVAGTEEDKAWYESIGAGSRPEPVMFDEPATTFARRAWPSLPDESREARFVARTADTVYVQARDGRIRRYDRADLGAEDEAYVASLAKREYDQRPVRIASLPAAFAYPDQPRGAVDVLPLAFSGREVLCTSPDGVPYASSFQALGFDLRSRKIFLGRCIREMDGDDLIRAAGVVRQAVWRETDGSPLSLDEFGAAARGFAVAFDGETLLSEVDPAAPTDEEDSIARLTGYRLTSVSAPETDEARRLLETLQRRSDEEGRPLASTEPLIRNAFAAKGRGENATLGEIRLWTGRLLRSIGPTEARLVSRGERGCAVLLEDGTLDLVIGLSEADAAYLNEVEGFLSPRVDPAREIVYVPADMQALDQEQRRLAARRWTTPQIEGVRGEAIVWDAEKVFVQDLASAGYAMVVLAEMTPEDRSWLESRPRPTFDAPMENWIPSATAKDYPQSPTSPFEGAPIAFNGRAVIFLLPGGKLPSLWTDFAALADESQRRILERFDATMEDRTRFLAAWRMGQGLWVDDAGQKRETFKFDPRMKFLPGLDQAIAYDGTYMALLLRRPPGVEGKMTRPIISLVSLGPEGGVFHKLQPQLRDRYLAASRPIPGIDVPKEIASAYERAGRAEPPRVGERRLWNAGTVRHPEPTWGRVVQVTSRSALILDDENRLDVTQGFTEEDCAYLNSLEGFHPVGATEEEAAPCTPDEKAEPLEDRIARWNEGRIDARFVRDLDEVIGILRRSGPYDSGRTDVLVQVMNALTSGLAKADVASRDEETTRIKAAVASGEMSQAAADGKLADLARIPRDPTDGSNETEKAIGLWKKELPESSIPWTLEAGALYGVAWDARGDGNAGEVTQEGWRVHETLIPRADAAIQRAAELTPNDYFLRVKQLQIARSAGYDVEKMREVLYAGLEGNRDFYALVDEMVFALLPRWFGEPGDVGRFAAEMMDYYGEEEGVQILNSIIHRQMVFEGSKLLYGEFPPEALAKAARYMAEHSSGAADEHVRAEVFAFMGGEFRVAWELKRRTLRSRDPELKRRRDIDWMNNWAIREFYKRLDGPPDVRRVRRIDFEGRNASPPSMAFADSNRLCLIDSGDGVAQAIDVFAMQPDQAFVVDETLSNVRYLSEASDRWLTGIGTDDAGVKKIMRYDSRGEFEPVVMRGTEPFPSVVAMSPFGDRIVAWRDLQDGFFTFWDASTGEVQGMLKSPFPVRLAQFAPSGERIAIWDGERKLAFVDPSTRAVVGETIELPGPCHFPQFVADGRLVFLKRSGTATEPRWNAVVVESDTGKTEELSESWAANLSAFGDVEYADDLSCAFVIAHPDAPVPDDRILAIDLATGETIAALDGHFGTVLRLKYRGDFQRLYSVAADRHLMEWDVSPEGLKAAKQNDAK